MKWFKNVVAYLKSYGESCSIAGLSYIANRRLHFFERIFWLLCVLVSTYGAYYLINQYRSDFVKKSVSIVYESLPPYTKYTFPAVAVCNYCKGLVSPRIEEFIQSNCKENCKHYDYNKESQLLLFVCPEKYRDGAMRSECQKIMSGGKYSECIQQESRTFIEEVLNSPHWFKREYIAGLDIADLTITTSATLHVTVLNPEDIPNLFLPSASTKIIRDGNQKIFQVFIEKMINDNDVRDISPEYRKCRFPDEVEPTSLYKAHSFGACLNDCIRNHQMRLCNCAIQALVPKENPKFPPCDLRGLYCLESYSMIRPDAKNLLPWASSEVRCDCLPSCTEQTITAVYDSAQFDAPAKKTFVAKITIPTQATQSYRRQVLRTRLDSVVTIGGILGLFLGASILSGAELLYYFIRWICNSLRVKK